MAITFGGLKQYISRRIPIPICFRDGYYDKIKDTQAAKAITVVLAQNSREDIE